RRKIMLHEYGRTAMTALVLELVGIHKSFGRTEIIRGVDLAVPRGERHAIIGPNGAGKSTLFNLISGRFRPSTGTIRLDGADVTGARPQEINRRGLARSFQITDIFPRLSVWENVRCAVLGSRPYKYSFWHGVDSLTDVRERTEHILHEINLIGRRDTPAGVVTYAEERALEGAMTLAGGAKARLLGGPTPRRSRPPAGRGGRPTHRRSRG